MPATCYCICHDDPTASRELFASIYGRPCCCENDDREGER